MWQFTRQIAGWRLPRQSKLAEPERASSTVEQAPQLADGLLLLDESHLVPTFPIDVVYTWVDNTDPSFATSLAPYLPTDLAESIAGSARWTCNQELRYSLRSLEQYAPWVNNIYIVTNGQRPAWLATHPKVKLINHADILEREYLPTFNSHVIESALHRISGLSEHYIYFNDDVMLLRPLSPSYFFTASGLAIAYLGSVSLPAGPPSPRETATNWAAKNARNLIQERWGRSVCQRLAHSCFPQRKSVAEDTERAFADVYRAFRKNRLRGMDDVLVSAYLNQGVGYLTCRMLYARANCWYVLIRQPRAKEIYQVVLAQKGTLRARMTVCVNDHPVGANATAKKDLMDFLQGYFSSASSYEAAGDAT